jgi:hypothetical protein
MYICQSNTNEEYDDTFYDENKLLEEEQKEHDDYYE